MVERRLLDTDVLSAFFRNHPRVLARAADYLLEHAHLSISIMTYYKVRARPALRERHQAIERFDTLCR